MKKVKKRRLKVTPISKEFRVIKMDLFPWDILFTVGTTEKEICDYFVKKCGFTPDAEEKSFLRIDNTNKQGRCVKFKNNAVLIWIRKRDLGVLAHEAFHAVTAILETAGLKFSDSSDEAWAYAIEYVISKAIYPKK